MKPVLSRSGRKALAEHLSKSTIVVFDFDGVLAPLIASRHAARPKPSTVLRLNRLVTLYPVAVVSGRGRNDVKSKLFFRPKSVVGNHGIEGIKEYSQKLKRAKQVVKKWHRELLANEAIFKNGGEMENKVLSLTLHFRRAHNPIAARRAIVAAIRKLRPLPRVVPGKKVFNLVLPQSPNKGDAVKMLMRLGGFKRAIYLGDDATDEDVFRLEDSRILGVRVGKNRATKAKYHLPAQKDIDAFLDLLLKLAMEAQR